MKWQFLIPWSYLQAYGQADNQKAKQGPEPLPPQLCGIPRRRSIRLPLAHRCGGGVLQGLVEVCVGVFMPSASKNVQHAQWHLARARGMVLALAEGSSCSIVHQIEREDRYMTALRRGHAAGVHGKIRLPSSVPTHVMRSCSRTSPPHAPKHRLLILFDHLTNLDQHTRSQRPDLRLFLTATTD